MDLLGHLAFSAVFRCHVKSEKSQLSVTKRGSLLTGSRGIPPLSNAGICIEVGLSV